MNDLSMDARAGKDLDSVMNWIAGLYAQVLGIEDVQADDDFFVLGGSSISAMELLSAIREATGQEVPVKSFYQSTVVGLLAQTVHGLIVDHQGSD